MEPLIQEEIPSSYLPESACLKKEILGPDPIPEAGMEEAWTRAYDQFRSLSCPRIIYRALSQDEFTSAFLTPIADPEATPLFDILSRVQELFLFCGTVGKEPGESADRWFQEGDFLSGYLLDRLAAFGAEQLSRYLERKLQQKYMTVFLAYSPGYCGWPVEHQEQLFGMLHPEKIGVHLSESFVMHPMKSVSGALVGGSSRTHIFPLHYVCCQTCTTRTCLDRMREIRMRNE
ncbi:MAG: vitamin B12 dependent-methionine synthase activation domain-containing protein [Fidelibacterota bacterium]